MIDSYDALWKRSGPWPRLGGEESPGTFTQGSQRKLVGREPMDQWHRDDTANQCFALEFSNANFQFPMNIQFSNIEY